jgi:hypothetical protein
MLIMSLDPNWRQTLSLPPTGIEPGSRASQAGTLPKELSRQLIPVLRIRNVYSRSRILIFSHPGSWIQNSTKERGEKKLVAITFYRSINSYNEPANILTRRVGRVLSFFSSRWNWDSPNLSPARECAPPPPVGSGGRGTHAGDRGGWGVPILTRGYTL